MAGVVVVGGGTGLVNTGVDGPLVEGRRELEGRVAIDEIKIGLVVAFQVQLVYFLSHRWFRWQPQGQGLYGI